MFYPSYEDYMRDIFYFNGLQNQNSYPYMYGYNSQNLNDYFPAIYKIVYPVIQKVVSGNNYQFLNEDSVNNIVDVVLGITYNDVNNLENNGNNSNSQKQNMNNENKEQNSLLKDLIKILTIKELQSKQNVKRFPYTYGANYPLSFQNSPYMAN